MGIKGGKLCDHMGQVFHILHSIAPGFQMFLHGLCHRCVVLYNQNLVHCLTSALYNILSIEIYFSSSVTIK